MDDINDPLALDVAGLPIPAFDQPRNARPHRKLSASELDAILDQRRREARIAMQDRETAAALRARFPNCSGACEAGRSACACRPGEGSETGIEADPAYRAPRRRLGPIGPVHRLVLSKRPTYTWALVTVLAVLCAFQWVRS